MKIDFKIGDRVVQRVALNKPGTIILLNLDATAKNKRAQVKWDHSGIKTWNQLHRLLPYNYKF
jgi:hypothetical protein